MLIIITNTAYLLQIQQNGSKFKGQINTCKVARSTDQILNKTYRYNINQFRYDFTQIL